MVPRPKTKHRRRVSSGRTDSVPCTRSIPLLLSPKRYIADRMIPLTDLSSYTTPLSPSPFSLSSHSLFYVFVGFHFCHVTQGPLLLTGRTDLLPNTHPSVVIYSDHDMSNIILRTRGRTPVSTENPLKLFPWLPQTIYENLLIVMVCFKLNTLFSTLVIHQTSTLCSGPQHQ